MTSRWGLARHPIAIAGVVITTVSAVVFIALTIAIVAGLFEHDPYAGLVIFVAIPAVFVAGLLLVPLGMWLQRRRLRVRPEETAEWPIVDFGVASVRRTTLAIVALTAVNIVLILLAGYGSLHYMESPRFCGQACHTPAGISTRAITKTAGMAMKTTNPAYGFSIIPSSSAITSVMNTTADAVASTTPAIDSGWDSASRFMSAFRYFRLAM